MTKRKQNYRPCQSNKGGHFLALFDDMVESAAWKKLTANETVLYINIAIKLKVNYTKDNQVIKTNEDDITMVKKEYLKLMHPTTFEKSIDHLIDLGFIKVVESRYAQHKSTKYGLNYMWKHYGNDVFNIKNEWKRVNNRNY